MGTRRVLFTGAVNQRRGRFELADSGTLFLDEIGELNAHVQIKLLRVLETGRFERVGGEETLESNVRIIAATNKDLEEEIREGRFREDLYYRLNVINLELPPLKERREDIGLLTDSFLVKYAAKNKKDIKGFSSQSARLLSNYNWPGNVRELENVVERAVVMARNEFIEPGNLPSNISQSLKKAKKDTFRITIRHNDERDREEGYPRKHFTRLTAVSLKQQRFLAFLQEKSNTKSRNGQVTMLQRH